MNRLIAIETASDVCSVAVLIEGTVAAVRSSEQPKLHAEHLVPMIQDCLHEADLHPGDLNTVAVSSGPGSYTGLRIGVSTAKGLAFAASARIVAVPSLEAITYGILSSRADNTVIAVAPSRRNELYAGVFGSGKEGLPVRIIPEVAIKDDEFAGWLTSSGVTSGVLAGTAVSRAFSAVNEKSAFEPMSIVPSAVFVGFCSLPRIAAKEFEDTSSFEPYYLKEFEAKNRVGSIFDRLPF